jgi:hypothetical protein
MRSRIAEAEARTQIFSKQYTPERRLSRRPVRIKLP